MTYHMTSDRCVILTTDISAYTINIRVKYAVTSLYQYSGDLHITRESLTHNKHVPANNKFRQENFVNILNNTKITKERNV